MDENFRAPIHSKRHEHLEPGRLRFLRRSQFYFQQFDPLISVPACLRPSLQSGISTLGENAMQTFRLVMQTGGHQGCLEARETSGPEIFSTNLTLHIKESQTKINRTRQDTSHSSSLEDGGPYEAQP